MIDEDQLERIFIEEVAPAIFKHATPHSPRSLQLIGGAPGSGKTRAAVTVRGMVDHPVTPIIGDALRFLHPDFDRLMRSDPLSMPDATAAAAAYWVERALSHALDHDYSVLVEGTFRRPEVTLATAAAFRDAGYQVHAVALAVPAWESRLGIVDRFVTDHHTDAAARWTTLAAHDAGYHGTPLTVAALVDAGVVDRLTVLDRGSALLYDELAPATSERALDAIDSGRRRTPTAVQLEQFSTRLQANITYLEAAGLVDQRARPLLEALRADERALYEGDQPATLALRLAQLGTAIPATHATTAAKHPAPGRPAPNTEPTSRDVDR